MRRRIVITGIGVISPLGTGKEKFWTNLIRGKSGIGKARKIETHRYKTDLAAEVKDFTPQNFIDFRRAGPLTEATQYLIAGVKMAWEDADLKGYPPHRVGLAIGADVTADSSAYAEAITFWQKNKEAYSLTPPKIFQNLGGNLQAVGVSRYFNLEGPCTVVPVACTVGASTLAYGFELIRKGRVDVMFIGGYAVMNHLAYGGFSKINALAPDCCRPFDRKRRGMVIGEGAGVVVLEEAESALKRGAKIYAEVLGYGLACDAWSVAIPHPDGVGGIVATKKALKMAKVRPQDVDYVNAHGTGTIPNDKMETKVIETVFKRKGNNVLVSSLKSMIGHCLGASSALEICAVSLMMKRGIIPPTINYLHPDPQCDLNIVANKAIKKKIEIAVLNSFAFGGAAVVVVLGKFRK